MSLSKKPLTNSEKKTKTMSKADFWNWFLKNEKRFHQIIKSKQNITEFIHEMSGKINEFRHGFSILTGMCDVDTVELIVTVDGDIKNIIHVEELMMEAPQLTGWKFTAHKPPLTNLSIEMEDYVFSTRNMWFIDNGSTNYPDEISISILHPDLDEKNQLIIENGIFVFLSNFLGEINFLTTIDNINFLGIEDITLDFIQIEKLPSFLIWKQKEFIEKHDGICLDTSNNKCLIVEGNLPNGLPTVATIDQDLLNWDAKSSHPWIMIVDFSFRGMENGMPDNKTSEQLTIIYKAILGQLKDSDGYLMIVKEIGDHKRHIYFACKDFRKPTKIMNEIIERFYLDSIDFKIYKDKYWQSLAHFKLFLN